MKALTPALLTLPHGLDFRVQLRKEGFGLLLIHLFEDERPAVDPNLRDPDLLIELADHPSAVLGAVLVEIVELDVDARARVMLPFLDLQCLFLQSHLL